jgi:hypothetical protein
MVKNLPGGLTWLADDQELEVEMNIHEHVVTEPAGNDTVVHDGLVGLVLEVGLPSIGEVGSGPALKVPELLLCGTDLDTGVNAVGGERASSLEVPLIKDLWKYVLVAKVQLKLSCREKGVECDVLF